MVKVYSNLIDKTLIRFLETIYFCIDTRSVVIRTVVIRMPPSSAIVSLFYDLLLARFPSTLAALALPAADPTRHAPTKLTSAPILRDLVIISSSYSRFSAAAATTDAFTATFTAAFTAATPFSFFLLPMAALLHLAAPSQIIA